MPWFVRNLPPARRGSLRGSLANIICSRQLRSLSGGSSARLVGDHRATLNRGHETAGRAPPPQPPCLGEREGAPRDAQRCKATRAQVMGARRRAGRPACMGERARGRRVRRPGLGGAPRTLGWVGVPPHSARWHLRCGFLPAHLCRACGRHRVLALGLHEAASARGCGACLLGFGCPSVARRWLQLFVPWPPCLWEARSGGRAE